MNHTLAHGCEVLKNRETLVLIKSSHTENKVPGSSPTSFSLQTN
jgi:hypothetical protein